ncbi:hypothetical protein BO79DRAFT_249243 [Aspergillus costaricaensis CBS 115574]|uniref:Uncharacterized protein n=1 Tax=Aspergillus costaricaensis CBS 115574 TaxID=1448317 RepID=A0ACD1IUB9_9EURO|nr:hypothetical protein BO79DRAFT_249243 [Aspergillus costaricaensis CBS 115574]RAK94020.1 hypothetical protein BO79DRAFT_249243 [Aspergillus costaricaensis CBS 115574]
MPLGNQDSGVTGAAKFVTSTLGNAVGGVSRTVGGVTGAAGRGIGDTITGATGSAGKPVGDALGSVGSGVEDGARKVAKGIEDAGQWNSATLGFLLLSPNPPIVAISRTTISSPACPPRRSSGSKKRPGVEQTIATNFCSLSQIRYPSSSGQLTARLRLLLSEGLRGRLTQGPSVLTDPMIAARR